MKGRWEKKEESSNSLDDLCFFFKVNTTVMNVCPYEQPQKMNQNTKKVYRAKEIILWTRKEKVESL